MVQQSAEDSLRLARAHLERVQQALWDSTDWANLSTYGLYCLEACIVAAALHLGQPRPRNHFSKAETAENLSREHGLPDIGDVLIDLNNMRKLQAYGDTPAPVGMDPEDTASMTETYVDLVQGLLAR